MRFFDVIRCDKHGKNNYQYTSQTRNFPHFLTCVTSSLLSANDQPHNIITNEPASLFGKRLVLAALPLPLNQCDTAQTSPINACNINVLVLEYNN